MHLFLNILFGIVWKKKLLKRLSTFLICLLSWGFMLSVFFFMLGLLIYLSVTKVVISKIVVSIFLNDQLFLKMAYLRFLLGCQTLLHIFGFIKNANELTGLKKLSTFMKKTFETACQGPY